MSTPTELHVAPHGRADAPGTAEQPLDSLYRACKNLPAGVGGGIHLHPGVYGKQELTGHNVTVEVHGQAVIDGGLQREVAACYAEDFSLTIGEGLRKNVGLYIKNGTNITVQQADVNGRLTVQDCGRAVYVYNSTQTLLRHIHAQRVLFRAVGGWFKGLYLEDSTIEEACLMNYAERLRRTTGQSGGWPASITGTENYQGGAAAEGLYIRRCRIRRTWGEGAGFFATDGGELVDSILEDASHSVAVYLQQCRNVRVANNHIIITSASPRKTKNGIAILPHAIQIAREGTTFPHRAEGLVIEGNTIVGGTHGLQVDWSEFPDDYSGLQIRGNTIIGQTRYAINAPAGSMLRGTAEVRNNTLGPCKIERSDWAVRDNIHVGGLSPTHNPVPVTKRIRVEIEVSAAEALKWELVGASEASNG